MHTYIFTRMNIYNF